MSEKSTKYISKDERINLGQGRFKYESCYIPFKDESLAKLGIQICAETEFSRSGSIQNRITFRRGEQKSSVNCVHTAVCQITSSEKSPLGFETVSTEQKPILRGMLSPEEHYFALKSVVELLSEQGIQDLMIQAFERQAETGQQPIDMNHLMRQQISRALLEIAPEETKDLALTMLEYVVADDKTRMRVFSKDFKDVFCSASLTGEDVERLDAIDGGLKELPSEIRSCIVDLMNTDEAYSYDIAEILANDPSWEIRAKIAGVWFFAGEMLDKLRDDDEWQVRQAVASNPNIDENDMRKLATDEYWQVRQVIAQRFDLPKDLIKKLADDPMRMVRKIIAKRQSLSPEMVELLSRDVWDVREAIADRKDLPKTLMKTLAVDNDDTVRLVIAERLDLSPSLIEELVVDVDPSVREALARNEKIPMKSITELIEDEDEGVRMAIARRGDLSRDVYDEFYKLERNDEIREILDDRRIEFGYGEPEEQPEPFDWEDY